MMHYKLLRNSDLQVSALGLGTWAIGGEWIFDKRQASWGKVDDAGSIRANHAALDASINLIDTAVNDGIEHSEGIVEYNGSITNSQSVNLCIVSGDVGPNKV